MKLIIDVPNEVFEIRDEIENGSPLANLVMIAFKFAKLYEERQQGKWIPVSERLPNINTVYNVTRIIEGTAISDSCYFDGQNTWHRDTGVNHGRPYVTDIIAWQELPEPYEK